MLGWAQDCVPPKFVVTVVYGTEIIDQSTEYGDSHMVGSKRCHSYTEASQGYKAPFSQMIS